MEFIKRAGAEIGCYLDKKMQKKSFFIIEKLNINIEHCTVSTMAIGATRL